MTLDVIEYAEDVAAKTLEVARKAYDDLHDRAYKLATVLVAGAGGVGAFALGKFSQTDILAWAPLGALSLSWFGIAALLVLDAGTSRELSPGNNPTVIREYFQRRLFEAYDPEQALKATRAAELDLVTERIASYSQGCIDRARAVDLAYRSLVIASPLTLIVVSAAIPLARYLFGRG